MMSKLKYRPLGDTTYFNHEQQICISSSGGTIVSAGAGSGKTSILVEHLLSMIKVKCDKNFKMLDKIFVMTFTRKAGHELKFRLAKRIQELKQWALVSGEGSKKQHEWWQEVEKQVSRMFVGTIDSFYQTCIKDQKIWIDYDYPIELISDEQILQRWKEQLDYWCNELEKNELAILVEHGQWFEDLALLAIGNVDFRGNDLEQYLSLDSKNIIELWTNEFNEFYQTDLALKISEIVNMFSQINHPWVAQKVAGLKKIQTIFDFSMWHQEFETNMLRTPSKGEFRDSIKSLNEFRKESLWLYESLFVYKKYSNKFVDLSNFIPKFLGRVFKFLNNLNVTSFSGVQHLVRKSVKDGFFDRSFFSDAYFLVDEFQDTSSIQEEVLLYLCEGRKQQLFFVGDLKQAIYSFRGGDTKLMNHYLLEMPTKIDLSVNYRSHANIIEFVNATFAPHIYNFVKQVPLGGSFSQVCPINLHHLKFDSWNTSNKYVREENEIKSVNKIIQYLVKNYPNESICVLYRKNSIGRRLLYHALNSTELNPEVRLVFSASEDPSFEWIRSILWSMEDEIWSISQDKFELVKKSMWAMLSILKQGAMADFELEKSMKNFLDLKKMFGIHYAFQRLFLDHQIDLTTLESNLKLIDIHLNDFDSPFQLFQKWEDLRDTPCYLHFNSMEDVGLVFSTIHQSKGLEYDHVILLGVQENPINNQAKYSGIKEKLNSTKLSIGNQDLKKFETPNYRKFSENEKVQAMAESKRLFYVAATRAKNTLHFVINEEEEIHDESWISLCNFELMEHSYWFQRMDVNPNKNSQELSPVLLDFKVKTLSELVVNKPISKLLPDLSATKVASYDLCPRKFYYKNILKEAESIVYSEDDEKSHAPIKSSANRGSEFHKIVEQILASKLNVEEIVEILFLSDFSMSAKWFGQYLADIKSLNVPLYIEKELKFAFGPSIVNGTPDLFYYVPIAGQNALNYELYIIDFKTGSKSNDQDLIYKNQLMLYATAVLQNYSYLNVINIYLKIVFLDLQETFIKSFTVKEILDWGSTKSTSFGHFEIKNYDHCIRCGYREICLPTE